MEKKSLYRSTKYKNNFFKTKSQSISLKSKNTFSKENTSTKLCTIRGDNGNKRQTNSCWSSNQIYNKDKLTLNSSQSTFLTSLSVNNKARQYLLKDIGCKISFSSFEEDYENLKKIQDAFLPALNIQKVQFAKIKKQMEQFRTKHNRILRNIESNTNDQIKRLKKLLQLVLKEHQKSLVNSKSYIKSIGQDLLQASKGIIQLDQHIANVNKQCHHD